MNSALDVHPKVVGGTVTGSGGILIVWLLGLAHVTVDPVVAGALVVILGGLGAWLSPVLNAERSRVVQTYTTSGGSSGSSGTVYVSQPISPSPPKPRKKPALKPKP